MRKISMTQLMVPALALTLVAGLTACAGGSKWKGGSNDDDVRGRLVAEQNKLAKKGILATVATAKSADLQLGIEKVELDTRAQLARALETKIENMQKQFKEEVGEELLSTFTTATKSITSTVISGTKLSEQPYRELKDGRYEVHGLMILDPKLFKDALALQMANNQALKSRWAASKAYQELDKEVAEFEAYKKEQGR